MGTPASTQPTETFAEFGLRSNFSFLEGASPPEELAVMAARLGQHRIELRQARAIDRIHAGHESVEQVGLEASRGLQPSDL